MIPLPSRLLAVTDRHQAAQPLLERAAALFEAGVRWIWLRDRDLPDEDRRELARRLLAQAARAGAILMIGGDIGLAVAVRAAGVHVRQADDIAAARRSLGPRALIGVSAHSIAEVGAAAERGADYATLSPIFLSASKPGYGPALGLGTLADASRIGLPLLALGGVTATEAGDCLAAGAAGIAVMGPLMRAGGAALAADLTRIVQGLGV